MRKKVKKAKRVRKPKKGTSFASRVNFGNVEFSTLVGKGDNQPFVGYAHSTGHLTFNSRMVRALGLAGIDHVVCGVDASSGIIVLKKCDAEELGATYVKVPYLHKGATKQEKEVVQQKRHIRVGHLLEDLGAKPSDNYRAERVGNLIYLQATNGKV